jgi:hypothetical protein
MAHEEAKTQKIKTRRINVLGITDIYKYQEGVMETVKMNIKAGKNKTL